MRILSSLDQKTGRALKKAPRLLSARQAALVEVMNVCTLVRRRRCLLIAPIVVLCSGEAGQRSVRGGILDAEGARAGVPAVAG